MRATLASSDPALAAFAGEVGSTGPVAVAGGKTRWEVGGPVSDETRVLSAPDGIVDYQPDEMTVKVRAGTTVGQLHAALATKGQRTALPDRGGTVGGALAVGENDIRALGRGLLRTSLLQIRYVSAEGRAINGGGPTVKNVSGFDLPRLIVGSLGTLGLLAEAIIRTNPIPPVSRWIRCNECDPQAVFQQLLAPSAVLWDGSTTWVELEGHGSDVEAQHRAVGSLGTFVEVDVPAGELPVELPPHRWSLAPSGLRALGTERADSNVARNRFVAAIGLGLAFREIPQPLRSVSPEVDVIARRLKQHFDPTGRLNPGRDPGRK